MTTATNYALPLRTVSSRVGLVAGDVAAGFMATSRLIVTVAGCATLLGAAAIVSNDTARARFNEHAPAVIGHWLAPVQSVQLPVLDSPADESAPVVVFEASTDPQQKFVTQYLSRRYRVADEAVRRLVAAAYESGREHTLDPMLILAVMAVESSMNPFAESSVGAQGLMQVMTRVHSEKFEMHGGEQAALDPIANIKVGSLILKDLIRRGGSVERGLQLYVGAGNMDDDAGYGARVLAERARIALAASGKVDGALNAGMRADTSRNEVRASAAVSATPVSAAPPAHDSDQAGQGGGDAV